MGAMIEAGEIPADAPGGEVNGDALRLPFPDDSFDRIIASEVLEHLWDDTGAISELVRVLRPGGRLAVTVPTRFPERVSWAINYRYHDTPGGHVRIYRQHELETEARAVGAVAARFAPRPRAALAVLVAEVHVRARQHRAPGRCAATTTSSCTRSSDQPAWVAALDRSLNPVLGKSLVVYTQKVG